jgi:hypothetical protein
MEHLNWELSVLSQSVAYNNLSGASQHVGLSQPQLSRIVKRLEDNWNLVLLDRTAKRKATWTSAAYRLAKLYTEADRQLNQEIQKISNQNIPDHIRVGTLEGLFPVAGNFLKHIEQNFADIQIFEMDIHDLDILEERFFKGRFDFIFTVRTPGRKKFSFVKELGFQMMKTIKEEPSEEKKIKVLSSFEYETRKFSSKKRDSGRMFVSNSLSARRWWVDHFGGDARFPSEILANEPKSGEVLKPLLVGAETMLPDFWKTASNFKATH